MIFTSALQGVKHLFFPHHCAACGTVELHPSQCLCLSCEWNLPVTPFHLQADNPVERVFWGRLPFYQAASFCYFSKGSTVQALLHAVKYKGQKSLGLYLGKQMGNWLREADRFADADLILPMPLHPKRLAERGYNQATLLAEGLSLSLQIPCRTDLLSRPISTQTQTRKHREDRWQSMQGKFQLSNPDSLAGLHVLLVDDLITTGATLESAGVAFTLIPGIRLSLISFAFAQRW